MSAKIHPSAVVHPSAKLADGVEIGPLVFIGEAVEIGAGTVVGPHTIIEHATLGKENRISGQAAIGTPPQDLGYKGEPTRLIMGDRNWVREGCTFNRGTTATGKTVIGNDGMFMTLAHVAHDCRVGNNVIFANGATLGGHCSVGDRAFISAFVAVHQHCRIGAGVMIGGGAMVTQDIVPYSMSQGDRCRLRGLNLIGMRRAGIPRDAISQIKKAYQLVFLSGLKQDEAVRQAREGVQAPQAVEFVEFIASAGKRGVAHAFKAHAGEAQEAVEA
jgi:UDP-N-acetylglucosamine acyltransferase